MTTYAAILNLITSTGSTSIDLADDKASLTFAEAQSLASQGVVFAADDEISVKDDTATIEALDAEDIVALATLGVSNVLATDRAPVFDLAQVNAFADGNIATYARYETQQAVTSTDMPVGLAASGVKTGEVMVSLSDGSYVVFHRTEIDQQDSYIASQRFDASGNPIGNSTVISEETLYDEAQLAVSSLEDGGYVVAWTHRQKAVYTQRYDANGEAVGTPTQITTAVGSNAPSVLGLSDGGYVATAYQSTDAGAQLTSLRFDANGLLLAETANVTYVAFSGYIEGGKLTEMVELADGKVMVIWVGSDGSGGGVMGQIIDSDGTKVGASFVINTATQWFQGQQSVTALADGSFVVVWFNGAQDYTISMQRFDSAGGKIGPEVAVNSSVNPQNGQQVTALAGGGFVVTWMWESQDSPSPASGEWGGVYAQLFDADGNTVGPVTTVNTTVVGGQLAPKTVALADGGNVVVWQETIAANGDGYELNAQVFDAEGNKVGLELTVNVSEAANQTAQTVVALSDGGFAVTWYDESSRKYLTRAFQNDTEKATFSDTATAISGLTAADVADLAELGISAMSVSDGGAVTLTSSAATALIGISGLSIDGASSVTVTGTGAALAEFSESDIAALDAMGVSAIDASNDVLALSLAQAQAYINTGITLAVGDRVSVTLIATELAGLTASDLLTLASNGVDAIDLTGDAASMTLARLDEIIDAGLRFASGDQITIADGQINVGELTTLEIVTLASRGVSAIDLTDLYDPIHLSLAQAQAFIDSGIRFAADDAVVISLTASDFAALDAGKIADLASIHVDTLRTASSAVSIDAAQYAALLARGITIDAGMEFVTLADTGENLAALTLAQIAALRGNDIRELDATDDLVTLSYARLVAFQDASVSFVANDVVRIEVDSAGLADLDGTMLANALSFGATEITGITANLDATAATLATVLASGLVFADQIVTRLSDSFDNLVALTNLDRSDFERIGVDVIRLADTASTINALSLEDIETLATAGVTVLHATDGDISFGLDRMQALSGHDMRFESADTVITTGLAATFADPDTLDLAGLQSINVDKIDVTDNALTLSLDQANTYLAAGIGFLAADAITVTMTLAEANGLSSNAGTALETAGVGTLRISLSPSEIKALTVTQIAALGSAGINAIDIEPDAVTLSSAQVAAFESAGIDFAEDDAVSVHQVPSLANDTATAKEGATATVAVLSNDTAFDGLDLSLDGVTVTAGNGRASVNNDGTLSVSYTGADIDGAAKAKVTVSYTATDGIETSSATLVVTFTAVTEDLIGTSRGNRLTGGSVGELLNGLGGSDVLDGAGGNDRIYGGTGIDRLIGGAGADTLYGEAGRDTFQFRAISELGKTAGTTDKVMDFSHTQRDILDLHAIDANTRRKGDQDFTFIGSDDFNKVAGELRFEGSKSAYMVYGDTNGDGKADFMLDVHSHTELVASDFNL